MKEKIIKLISTKVFRKIVIGILGVLAARSDNEIDDAIVDVVKKSF